MTEPPHCDSPPITMVQLSDLTKAERDHIIEREVSIAQFAAQGGDDSPDTNPEDVEDTHAAMRAIARAVSD